MNMKLTSLVLILSMTLIGCSNKPPQNRTNAAWDSGHCDNLLKQMDELKGRPAQRTVILDRYEMECKNTPLERKVRSNSRGHKRSGLDEGQKVAEEKEAETADHTAILECRTV